ncbi:AbrB/MazE/SpoVT family DNA-binding domain-containing protein [Halosimplex litoreum]|uniref:AbrB/MazE/SpoVT family DNA-binding domain-containing protein n=1 Tax=Halosimplex litoreum TaxID=1198301 RepID=A0A7T3KUG5_9EURY|nr:AbrB/MazE/SpoVT family DNA-binding domain-containing protein [Halosimplex litoreum]QPV61740.1 AbrB/MazE/SpoVT family DNA-binding domain-containing protein [Halosimplex litoreum]
MGTSEDRRVDEKGRVTIPKSIREALQIDPGEEVAVELADDRIVIRNRISREQLVERLEGCVSEETRADDADRIDPDDLKADWTSDLPN